MEYNRQTQMGLNPAFFGATQTVDGLVTSLLPTFLNHYGLSIHQPSKLNPAAHVNY